MNYEEKRIFKGIAGELGDICLWLLILYIGSCTQCARAESINVTLFRVHSANSVSTEHYNDILLKVRKQYRTDLNVKLRVRQKHIYEIEVCYWDPSTDLDRKSLYAEYDRWLYWADRRRLSRKRSYGWIIGGAISPQKYNYSWGLASQGCSKQMPRYFVATGIFNNGLGANRLDYSAKTIAHELGHTIGAGHVGDRSLMNTNMGSFYEQDQYTPFSPFSIEQIKRCLSIKGVER